MKKLVLLLLLSTVTICGLISCEDDPEPQPVPEEEIDWIRNELYYLQKVSDQLNSTSPDYPSPWSVEDESTWKDIRIDTIIDEETGKKYRVIGAMTIYLNKECITPSFLGSLTHMKELRIYACSGAYFRPRAVPANLTTLIVDRLDSNDSGLILLNEKGSNNYVADFGLRTFEKRLEIHGVKMKDIKWRFDYDSEVDLSGNCLTGDVAWEYSQFKKHANLSNNNFTSMNISVHQFPILKYPPNLQNNNIPIPEEWLKTEFWKENHEKFKGNPGYRPPED